MKQSSSGPEPRYLAWKVLLVCPFRPILAVRRGDHLPLWKAWGIHIAGMVMLLLVAWFLDALGYALNSSSAEYLLGRMYRNLEELLRDLQEPTELAGIAAVTLASQVAVAVAAAIGMSWCAGHENMRTTYTRALRRLYLLTPHAAVILLVIGTALVWINEHPWRYDYSYQFVDILTVLTVLLGFIWPFSVLLLATANRSTPAMSRWPACCDRCGYVILGIDKQQGCPECGLALQASLDPAQRPGIAPTPKPGLLFWWVKTTCFAVFRPGTLGKQLHTLSPDFGYRRCLTISLAMLIAACPTLMAASFIINNLLMVYIQNDRGISWDEIMIATLVGGLMIGMWAAGIAITFTLAVASIVGAAEGWRLQRNLMPAAIRAACYQSGFFLIWLMPMWLYLLISATAIALFLDQLNYGPPTWMPLLFLGYLALGLLGLLLHLLLVSRAARKTRHANW